jgi:hypothetical protein
MYPTKLSGDRDEVISILFVSCKFVQLLGCDEVATSKNVQKGASETGVLAGFSAENAAK